ncbi:MAG: DMT family transporter [bacterium]
MNESPTTTTKTPTDATATAKATATATTNTPTPTRATAIINAIAAAIIPTTPSAHADDVRLAIWSILLTVFVLSFGDAMVKFISGDFPLWQIYLLRSLIALPALFALLAMLARRNADWRPRPVALGWTLLRSVLMVVMWTFYYVALPHIHFSVAATVLYTIPLFITLLSALFTGDRVGARAWLAVAFGFVGVVVVVRPAAADFNAYALLPLISAILFALAMILTRTKCRGESTMILALGQNLMFALASAAVGIALLIAQPSTDVATQFLLGDWVSLGAAQWGVMITLGATVVIGNIFGALAYQRGPSPIVATFDYSYLAFSLLWGLLLFAEVPDLPSAIGMGMIAASGVAVVRQARGG